MIAVKYVLLFVCAVLISACATVLKGYVDKVAVINPPADLTIQTPDGVTIPCLYDSTVQYQLIQNDNGVYETRRHVERSYFIQLRSNKFYTLYLRSAEFEKNIERYPKLGAMWFILDTITGVLPLFIDMYTECWNHFDDIHCNSAPETH